MGSIEGVFVTDLKQVHHPKGDIFHVMKRTDQGFSDFGEAYFSTIQSGQIKGWKKHTQMVMNIVVPLGYVKFVLHDTRENSPSYGFFQTLCIGQESYKRITIPPNIWVGFKGIFNEPSWLLNVANIEHNPNEAINVPLEYFNYNWNCS